MSLMFNGIGVSRGIAIGEAHVLKRHQIDVTERHLAKSAIPNEIKRLKKALKAARTKLSKAQEAIPKDAPSEVSAFLETHLLMLDDSLLSQRPIEIIKATQCNAEAALQQQREALAKVFESMEDQYLATRIDDINHVINSVLNELDETKEALAFDQWKGQIVIADDLTPADTVNMQNHGVAGFVTETGGQLSHTAILARSLGIPAIVGIHNIRQYVKPGETLSINGGTGMVLAAPTQEMLLRLKRQQKDYRASQRELSKLVDERAVTVDGVELNLSANIEIEDDIKALKRVNAQGVGLYRTEFLYLNQEHIPTEQEHYRVYTKVLRALKGAPLTIRTADLGADKNPTHDFGFRPGPLAHNPAMGLRGIRLCLSDHSLLIPQFRAILRASAKGPIRILLPMLTNVLEVKQTLELLNTVKQSLQEQGVEFDRNIPVGGMIEVPAAAIAADQFAQVLDFLSIGTNDLIQYTLAIDRIDDQVDYLYDPIHPAVLKLIKMTIDAGTEAKIPVALCGEMAGDPRYVRLLLGLGLTEFSMQPNSLLEVKRSLIQCKRSRARKIANSLLRANSTEEQLKLLNRLNENH
ncbi:MAG: phosphoenolpyruvate--protein phosphotransferase [Gammaproteobacteria bacterium]|nr:phosphoenolpyruvate--protein phosphotransferase [Gammaproteobacteria bacterium]